MKYFLQITSNYPVILFEPIATVLYFIKSNKSNIFVSLYFDIYLKLKIFAISYLRETLIDQYYCLYILNNFLIKKEENNTGFFIKAFYFHMLFRKKKFASKDSIIYLTLDYLKLNY